jgi:hypothetical protein
MHRQLGAAMSPLARRVGTFTRSSPKRCCVCTAGGEQFLQVRSSLLGVDQSVHRSCCNNLGWSVAILPGNI